MHDIKSRRPLIAPRRCPEYDSPAWELRRSCVAGAPQVQRGESVTADAFRRVALVGHDADCAEDRI